MRIRSAKMASCALEPTVVGWQNPVAFPIVQHYRAAAIYLAGKVSDHCYTIRIRASREL
jgi:hypothetical protein